MQSEARLKNFEKCKEKHAFCVNKYSQKYFPCVSKTFPVFSLSGKSKNQIPFSLCRGHPDDVMETLLIKHFDKAWRECTPGRMRLYILGFKQLKNLIVLRIFHVITQMAKIPIFR